MERARTDLREALYLFESSYEDIQEEVVEVKGSDLTAKEKMVIHRTMSDMTAPYLKLLRTTEAGLSDEFGLEKEIVDQFVVKARGND